MVTRTQLLDLGFHSRSIEHRVRKRRLHPVHRGVYAAGRPELTREGRWMGAVLACGPRAALSHASAAALLAIRSQRQGPVEVTVPAEAHPRRPGIKIHRRDGVHLTRHNGIPVTTPICTLVDLATRLNSDRLEAAINEADKLGLTDPEALRQALDAMPHRPGAKALRRILDRRTFALTASRLERRFLPLVREAGLPKPETGQWVDGYEVDFYWRDLGLVVETDGLRYHRTPAEQAKDRLRDQIHTAAGLTCLRFTHDQVALEPEHVRATLAQVARRR